MLRNIRKASSTKSQNRF